VKWWAKGEKDMDIRQIQRALVKKEGFMKLTRGSAVSFHRTLLESDYY
jgi:hypothetical protein